LFDTQIITLLLDAGADIEAESPSGHTPLKWLGAKIEKELNTDHYLGIMVILIERGANFIAVSLDSRIYFYFRASWKDKEKAYWMASKFCAKRADPDKYWVDQRTLSIAAAHGNELIMKLFIDKAADVKHHSIWSKGPLLSSMDTLAS